MSLLHWPFLINLIFAIIHFAGSYLATQLALPPANSSSVCSGAGIALAAFLVYGKKASSGIIPGILVAPIYSYLDLSSSESLFDALSLGFIFSMGL